MHYYSQSVASPRATLDWPAGYLCTILHALCVFMEVWLRADSWTQVWSERMSASEQPIGEILRELRTEKGLSLAQVNEASNDLINPSHLAQVERGKIQQPSLALLRSLAEVYHLEFHTLLQRVGIIDSRLVGRSDDGDFLEEPLSNKEFVLLSAVRDLDAAEFDQVQSYANYVRQQRK